MPSRYTCAHKYAARRGEQSDKEVEHQWKTQQVSHKTYSSYPTCERWRSAPADGTSLACTLRCWKTNQNQFNVQRCAASGVRYGKVPLGEAGNLRGGRLEKQAEGHVTGVHPAAVDSVAQFQVNDVALQLAHRDACDRVSDEVRAMN